GLAVGPGPDGERLYIPSRSNQNLVFVDFEPGNGTLSCDAADPAADIPRCGDVHRRGAEGTVTSERELTLRGDPVDVAAAPLAELGAPGEGNFVLVALRDTPLRESRLALFVEGGGADRL